MISNKVLLDNSQTGSNLDVLCSNHLYNYNIQHKNDLISHKVALEQQVQEKSKRKVSRS